MDLSILDTPTKTNNKVQGKFKHELGGRGVEEFIALNPKTYNLVTHRQRPFKNGTAKGKGIKKENNGKHEDCYNALMENKERIVKERKTQRVGDKRSTIKTSKRSLNNFDDKVSLYIILKAILMMRICMY